jgi:chemotaxis protein MotB
MQKKRRQHDEEHLDETWLIPYADLLTLLLALFIVLFASSTLDAKKYDRLMEALSSAFNSGTGIMEQPSAIPVPVKEEIIEQSPRKDVIKEVPDQQSEAQKEREKEKERLRLQGLKEKIDQYIRENNLQTQLKTEYNQSQLIIRIRDHAFFTSGSAVVRPDGRKLAAALSQMLTDYPEFEIMVAGHTDNHPIRTKEFESNWDLSTQRALNFMKILLLDPSITPNRFSAVGYGEFRPIATNDTEKGRAENRRVEIAIFRGEITP